MTNGPVGGDVDAPSQHHLVEVAGRDPLDRRGHQVLPVRVGQGRRQGELVRWLGRIRVAGLADPGVRSRGAVGLAEPSAAMVVSQPRRRAGRRAAPGRRPAPGRAGSNGRAPMATGPQPGSPTSSSTSDGAQGLAHRRDRGRVGQAARELQPQRHALSRPGRRARPARGSPSSPATREQVGRLGESDGARHQARGPAPAAPVLVYRRGHGAAPGGGDQLGDPAGEQAPFDRLEAGRPAMADQLGRRRAGRPPTSAGSGRRRGPTAGRRSGARRGRSTRRGRPAAADGRAWPRRAGRCGRPGGGPGPARRRAGSGRRSSAGRTRSPPRRGWPARSGSLQGVGVDERRRGAGVGAASRPTGPPRPGW